MKTCFKCDRVLPLSEFYPHPGTADRHLNKCKECTKKDARQVRKNKIEHYREYDRERGKKPHRIANSYRVVSEYRAEFPERYKANLMVGNAVRDGHLIKQPCERCGDPNSHGHHEDYSKPLEVIWLCAAHHKERHKELRDMGIEL